MTEPELFTFGPNVAATTILDSDHERVRKLTAEILQEQPPDIAFLRNAHLRLVELLSPVYSLNEWQPASVTLAKRCGSCSQRMACLETLARCAGIPTRVHVFRVKGSFWHPRFRLTRWFLPANVLLVWPQFFVAHGWVDFDELHAPITQLARKAKTGFKNDGESLFEAVIKTPVDFCGKTCSLPSSKLEFNLSTFISADEGLFKVII
jgi:Transglutaminase-like superfamily